jgi:hypothetical protein
LRGDWFCGYNRKDRYKIYIHIRADYAGFVSGGKNYWLLFRKRSSLKPVQRVGDLRLPVQAIPKRTNFFS